MVFFDLLTVNQGNGNILTLATSQGQVTVNISSDTTIEKTINATVSDLSQGNFVTIGGTTDSLGNLDATSIMVRTQGLSDQSFSPITTTPGNGGNTTSPNSDFPGGNIGHQMTMGTIDDINGDIITVTTAQSQVTVNVGTDTVIQKTVSGTFSDLQIGDSLTIVGPTDDNGNITATSISIRPPGQSFPGIQSTNNPN